MTGNPLRRERGPHSIVVIQHEPGCPLDRMGGWLGGAAVDVVRPYTGDAVPRAAEHGLIVLGGQVSAYDDEVAPWLPAVRDLLAASVAAAVPTLGICLGAQLLAVVCGGTVDVPAAAGRESGVIDVHWRPAAASDPLVSGLPGPYPGPSMHADAVSALPAGGVWLAASDRYPYQAFRLGDAAWGVQFHPEVSLATFRSWAEIHPEVDTEAVVTEFKRYDEAVAQAGRQLTDRFVELCLVGSAGVAGIGPRRVSVAERRRAAPRSR
jgi:GMP synthase (glutamine-hydrolysing)